MAVVALDNVSVTLGGVRILESVSAVVPEGSSTAIIGPNGAGKTTLLLAMLGQMPYTGRIQMGQDGARRPRLGYVPQRLALDRGMPLTVMDLLVMGVQRRPLWLGSSNARRGRARQLMADVKAENLATRRIGTLSGGELQRVLLALAIQQEPEILILDEPAAGVDIGGENLLCELLDRLQRQRGFTQIMVTHDLSLVTAHASHVICLNRRVMGQGETRSTLTEEVLAATFGIHLGLADLRSGPYAAAAACCGHDHDHEEGHGHD